MSAIGRRVIDRVDGSQGAVVDIYERRRYRVAWDVPTPYQDTARCAIPSSLFAWAEAQSDDTEGAP